MKKTKGFTTLELMIVMAIIALISTIGIVAVNRYTKSLRLNEMDSTAKEIFIAVQNQLTKAKASGTLKRIDDTYDMGTEYTMPDGHTEYYIVYNGSDTLTGSDARNIILPFGSIDDTIRSKRSYVIRYCLDTATVSQVYYSDEYNFALTDLTDEFKSGITNREDRKSYNGKIIGYYEGDVSYFNVIDTVKAATISVENGNRLLVKTTVSESGIKTLLCIRGMISHGEATIDISEDGPFNEKVTVIDDITHNNTHFANITSTNGYPFFPGEDVELYVITQASGQMSNVEESKHIVENSLFASIANVDGSYTARISNARHLQNLDKGVSNLTVSVGEDEETPTGVHLVGADQLYDIDWNDFMSDANIGTSVTTYDSSEEIKAHTFAPITMNNGYTFTYNGKGRYIDGITVDTTNRHAGLFGLADDVTVQNLELHNFNISTTKTDGSAGTVVGTGVDINIENVLAYNPKYGDDEEMEDYIERERKLQVNASYGSAGGLVGNVTEGTITNSGASVYVSAKVNGGGVAGVTNRVTFNGVFAGGHTTGGYYLIEDTRKELNAGRPNVTGSKAGGIVGNGRNGRIQNSYSTCSVKGSTEENTNAIKTGNIPVDIHTYGLGLICTSENEKLQKKHPSTIDSDFISEDMKSAVCYDEYHLNDVYTYKTINELKGEENEIWFLNQHVGDWALPGYTNNIVNQPTE